MQFSLLKPVRKVQLSWVSAFSILLGILFLYTSVRTVLDNFPKRQMEQGPYTPASAEIFSYLENSTETQDIIVFFKPRVLSFMINRQSLRIRNIDEIKEGKGDYLLYYKPFNFGQLKGQEYEELQNRLQPTFENSEYILYKLDKLQEAPDSFAVE